MTPRAVHPHDVPVVEHVAAVTGAIRHHHRRLPLVRCPRVVSRHHRGVRGNPVGVIAVADEGRTPGNAIPLLSQGSLQRAANLPGDHDVGTAAVGFLCARLQDAGAEVRLA
jgi:hypothetical protein